MSAAATDLKRSWPSGEGQALTLGASRVGEEEWAFAVWAPDHDVVLVRIEGDDPREVALAPAISGYHFGRVDGLTGDPTYRFVLDGHAYADPASRRQPSGVHGPSQGFDPAVHTWHDGSWVAPEPADLVIYELHVGTFTESGTFDGAVKHLDELVDLGINAVEPMPIAAFPGERNWGYDGAFPFAVQESYGGPEAFQRFVDECHVRGLAVILDVVYNHLGPEGTVHPRFGPYFTDTYATPWGPAINFAESGSDEVRRYFTENALMWLRDFHVDGLRLDAIHGIVDPTASPFLREVTIAIDALGARLGRRFIVIAESADNNPLVVHPARAGGLGFDLQWNDDFHHALHAVLTGERDGYYLDFGSLDQLATAYTHGFVFRGEHSRFRGRRHGCYAPSVPADRLVVFAQNHDQIGNRAGAERLVTIVGVEKAQLALAATLLAPNVPLLFMGEEYAETAPFPYFVDHGDPDLIDAVRRGRAEEFGREGDLLDPADEATYLRARLDRGRRDSAEGQRTEDLVRRLIELRRTCPVLRATAADESIAYLDGSAIVLYRRQAAGEVACVLNFSDQPRTVALDGKAVWRQLFDSSELAPSSTPADGHVMVDGRVPVAPWGFAVCTAGEPEGAGE